MRDLAARDLVQLGLDAVHGRVVVGLVYAAVDVEQTLDVVHAAAGVIAQRARLAQLGEQLAGGRAAVHRVEHAQRRRVRLLHALAQAPAHGQLALGHVHCLPEHPRLGLDGVHAHVGAYVEVQLAARKRLQRRQRGGAHGGEALAAAVEYLHRAGGKQLAVAARQLGVVYGLGLVRVGHNARAQILVLAHQLYQPLQRVGHAVVFRGAYAVGQLGLLAVHIVGQQQSAARVRSREQFTQQLGRAVQLALAAGEVAPFGEGGVKAAGAHLAHAYSHRHGHGAVQQLQAAHYARHVRAFYRPAAQHAGYERVEVGVLPLKLVEQHHAHRGGLELVRAQRAQKHAGHDLLAAVFHANRLT